MSARSLPASALLLAALILGIVIRLDGITRTIPTRTYERPLGDDSFYYFSLGRNLASGHGFRVDSENVTTGFQPLWGVLVALPYRVDPAYGLQGAQWLGVLVGLAAFALVFGLTRRLSGSPLLAAVSAALWWLLPSTVNASLSGMETTLAVAAALAVFVALDRWHEAPTLGRARWLGAALGVAVLARVDLVVLAIAVVAETLTPSPGLLRPHRRRRCWFGPVALRVEDAASRHDEGHNHFTLRPEGRAGAQPPQGEGRKRCRREKMALRIARAYVEIGGAISFSSKRSRSRRWCWFRGLC